MAYLKWAGGKAALLKDLVPLITNGQTSTHDFYDVFAGAGTVAEAVAPYFRSVFANDRNKDLIAAHRYVINHGQSFVDLTARFFVPGQNSERTYLAMRHAFNTTATGMEKAAIFIYLNRHCYNGLCRYNMRGVFNTPYGRYKKPQVPADQMLGFQRALGKADVSCNDFENVMLSAKAGDVVYCDPPYWPTNAQGFTRYESGGFTRGDQERLAAAAERCPARVIISNHDLPETRALYAKADRIIELSAPRRISSSGDRTAAKELVAIYERGA